MTDQPGKAVAEVFRILRLTKERELDCDEYTERLAELVEGNVSPELERLMKEHGELCPECEEQLELLRRCLEGD